VAGGVEVEYGADRKKNFCGRSGDKIIAKF